jgi:hypothetical protein
MDDIQVLFLNNTFEGSKWIKICDRDPSLSERELSEGIFWTCDFSSDVTKPKIRLFDDNVWYLKSSKDLKWNPNFEFTHWLKQGFYVPDLSSDEIEEIDDYRAKRSEDYRNQLIFYI